MNRRKPSPRPKILIVGLMPAWTSIARLPRALQEAGFEVGLACFENSFLAATHFRDHFFPLPAGCRREILLRQIEIVVGKWQPELILPGDEDAVAFLVELWRKTPSKNGLAGLLKRSLGNPMALIEAMSKRLTLEQAARSGIRIPVHRRILSRNDISDFAGRVGFPFVLKRSSGWGGTKVIVCRTDAEMDRISEKWFAEIGWKQHLRVRRKDIIERLFRSRRPLEDRTVIANEFISGRRAMCQAIAFQGRMCAALTAVKETTFPTDLSPSSALRFVRNEEMRAAAQKLIRAWKLTGIIGFDFVINQRGAYLIECNPRPISIAHLGGLVGEDLCRALYCALTSQPMPPMKQEKELTVAHFPHEQSRDPGSPHLREGLHDVPADDPELFGMLSRLGDRQRADQTQQNDSFLDFQTRKIESDSLNLQIINRKS
ncbi:MAG TPA: ATP-grasp domain-containing protein [Verrucomicrobiae bacterium]|nr:ATP-grasp domain-containing protein [Verrucomicrobiae bacterium]